jgi:hypothetical protein
MIIYHRQLRRIDTGTQPLPRLNEIVVPEATANTIAPHVIEMKGITRCKLTIISESAICKKFLGQIWSYTASL